MKSRKSSYQIIALACVLLIAAFLRLYRISELTEFLGDQGRTGIHIYQAWKDRILPLVGPTVLSGEHLGPAFYYIIAPSFFLTGFNPVMPAVFTAILGVGAVGLLWFLGREFFGWQIATLLSALWAVSPQIVSSDRVLWEPNIIPFFVLLYMVGIYKLKRVANIGWGILTGAALAVLVQLHYPNLLFVVSTLLFYAVLLVRRKEKASVLFRSLIGTALGFVVILLPFLVYERSHGFEDIVGVLRNFFSGGGIPFVKRQILANVLDYGGRVIRRVVQFPAGWEAVALLILLAISFFKRNFWKSFIALWFFAGIGAMSLYRGVVYDHYLFFLLPAPFLLFGFLLKWLEGKGMSWVSFGLAVIFSLSNISRLDINKIGFNDIARTNAVVKEIAHEATDQPFSFGLIASRSFSDLHYRYFFLTQGLKVESVLSDRYQTLFLVCESTTCPSADNLVRQGKVQVICYDSHCSGEYPKIDVNKWKFDKILDINDAKLYFLKR